MNNRILITIILIILISSFTLKNICGEELITTTVKINPEVSYIEPGEIITIDISCNPTQSIEGYEFDLIFDATYIQIDSISEGNIFEGFQTWFNPGTIDNINGYVNNIYSLIIEDGNTSESGTLAIIALHALLKNGSTTIQFNDTGISNDSGYIPINVQNGTIHIGDNKPFACFSWVDSDDYGPDTTISFDASCSNDDYGIINYEWDWDSDGIYDYTGGTQVYYNYGDTNVHQCTLQVTDTSNQKNTVSHNVSAISSVAGDMNGDDRLNSADIRYLALYICGDPEYSILFADGDVNSDARTNSADVRYLAMHLNGHPEYNQLYP